MLYVGSRKLIRTTVIVCLLGLASGLLGGQALTFLFGTSMVIFRWRYVFVLLAAAVCVMSLSSPVPTADRNDTGPLAKARVIHLRLALAIGSVVAGLAGLGSDLQGGLSSIRAFWFWFGVAMFSAALIGERLAWLLPMATLFPLIRWGNPEHLPAPPAWNWAQASPALVWSWVFALSVLAAGAAAFWWSSRLREYATRPGRKASNWAATAG